MNLQFFTKCASYTLIFFPVLSFAELNSSLRVGFDNDVFTGTDRDYTHSTLISYSKEVKDSHLLIPDVYLTSSPYTTVKQSWDFGQKMWTPTYIIRPIPGPNERPYTGLLYGESSITIFNPKTVHRYGFLIGTTGKRSLAGSAQDTFHETFDVDSPQGWGYQVKSAIMLNASYDYHNSLLGTNKPYELAHVNRATAGNFRSDIATGLVWRWGRNLNDSLGAVKITNEHTVDPAMIKRSKSGSFYFAGIEGRYRFNDVTIQGDRPEHNYCDYSADPNPANGCNSFDDPSGGVFPIEFPEMQNGTSDLHLQKLQTTAIAGFVAYKNGWGVSLAFAGRTRDYKESIHNFNSNGSLNLFRLF